ncbi:hypothetical protein IH824_14310 [candidate division KSB1 bacterium]|nr:hypothetical protein [candidate division KSB1 bacterium]
MKDPFLVLGSIIALGVLYVMLPVFMDVLMRYRKSKIVTCPHKNEKASVDVDAKRAAFTALAGKPKLHLKDCPLWHDEIYCNQECLSQL